MGMCASSMKGLVYRLQVFEGGNDWIHGGGQWVAETYFPDVSVMYNRIAGWTFMSDPKQIKDGTWTRYPEKCFLTEFAVSTEEEDALKTFAVAALLLNSKKDTLKDLMGTSMKDIDRKLSNAEKQVTRAKKERLQQENKEREEKCLKINNILSFD